MENNRVIFWICLVISVVGVILISVSQPKVVTSLSPELVGQEVVLTGVVTSKIVRNNTVFLRVNGFKAVVFNNAKYTDSLFQEGTRVSLRGFVKEYNGEIELVVRDLVDSDY